MPPPFRLLLTDNKVAYVMAYPSIKHNCIECCSFDRFQEITSIIQSLDPYSEARDAFETIILGNAVQLHLDTEGRVCIPNDLTDQASIDNQVCFVGKGVIVEMWNPQMLKEHKAKAKEIAQRNRSLLKNII